MIKKSGFVILLFLLTFLLVSCASIDLNDGFVDDEPNQDEIALISSNQLNRKIIYEVSSHIYTSDIEEAYQTIKTYMTEDSWFDNQSFYTSSIYLVIRIKTNLLDGFIDYLNDHFSLNNYTYKATDISLTYQNTEYQIDALLAQRARLVILYDQASLTDMITINQKISEIDLELGKLQGTLNAYDSLIDYSTVTLNIYKFQSVESIGFGQEILNGFSRGFSWLLLFIQELFLVIAYLLPIIIFITPIAFLIYKLYHRHQRKVKDKLKDKDKIEYSSKL